jgi:hypothetical protein
MTSSTTASSVPTTLLEETVTGDTATTPTMAVMVGTSAHEISERMHQRIDRNDGVTISTTTNFNVATATSDSTTTTVSSTKPSSQSKRKS